MPSCNMCGKCCYTPTGLFYPSGARELKPCKYLIKTGEKYYCKIYNRRLGVHINTDAQGNKYYCKMYNDIEREIKGCPLNVGGKPLFNVEIINKGKAIERKL